MPRVRRLLPRPLFEEDQKGDFDKALVRTHLANERTFLAWLRSALVLVGVGLGAIALGSDSGDFRSRSCPPTGRLPKIRYEDH